MRSDFTILVQGPPNKVSLDALEYYRSVANVAISTWHGDVSIMNNYYFGDCEVRLSPLPKHVYFVGKPNETFTYQIYSILSGLECVRTPFVIRTRSDEAWYNLEPLIEFFLKNENKIVCGNIFFKRWSDFSFHIGDHLIVGRTNHLRDAYNLLRLKPDDYGRAYCAEQSAAWAMLDAAGLPKDRHNFELLFDVFDINNIKPFRSNWVHGGREFVNEFEDSCVIKKMEEL
jgi:hypothetical protein